MVPHFVHLLSQVVHCSLLKIYLALYFSYFLMHASDHDILSLAAINRLYTGAHTEFLVTAVL